LYHSEENARVVEEKWLLLPGKTLLQPVVPIHDVPCLSNRKRPKQEKNIKKTVQKKTAVFKRFNKRNGYLKKGSKDLKKS
jgi:hypothetical protein